MSEEGLATDRHFWYKLKVDYDEVDYSGANHLVALIRQFFRGKKSHVEKEVDDPDDFLRRVGSITETKIRSILISIYLSYSWDEKKSGPVYITRKGGILEQLNEVLKKLGTNGNIILEEGIGGYKLLWFLKPALVDEKDAASNRIIGNKLLQADVTILKVKGDQVELRGGKADVNHLKRRLSESKLIEVRPQLDLKPLTTYLDSAIERENPLFELVGIQYLETNLPNRSKLTLQNPRGIRHDIKQLSTSGMVSPLSFTEISRVVLHVKKLGKDVRIRIRHLDDGFAFEIDDKKLIESERQEIKELLLTAFNISLDKIYDYKIEHDERFIFHKIVSGNLRAHKKFYDSLSKSVRELVDGILRINTVEKERCLDCDRESDSNVVCPNCGSSRLQTIQRKEPIIDESQVTSFVMKKCRP